jgi:hypothetical protein
MGAPKWPRRPWGDYSKRSRARVDGEDWSRLGPHRWFIPRAPLGIQIRRKDNRKNQLPAKVIPPMRVRLNSYENSEYKWIKKADVDGLSVTREIIQCYRMRLPLKDK